MEGRFRFAGSMWLRYGRLVAQLAFAVVLKTKKGEFKCHINIYNAEDVVLLRDTTT